MELFILKKSSDLELFLLEKSSEHETSTKLTGAVLTLTNLMLFTRVPGTDSKPSGLGETQPVPRPLVLSLVRDVLSVNYFATINN